MATISAIFSKEYKVYNHRIFFKVSRERNIRIHTTCIHTPSMHMACVCSHVCTYLHIYVTTLIPFYSSLRNTLTLSIAMDVTFSQKAIMR